VAEQFADLRAGFLRVLVSEGGDFVLPISYKPNGVLLDLSTGYTALLQIWRTLSDTLPVVVMTDTDGITLAATSPNILVDATQAQIDALDAGTYRWGLRLTPTAGQPIPILYGPFIVEAVNVRS
jgi:hypothetical protein